MFKEIYELDNDNICCGSISFSFNGLHNYIIPAYFFKSKRNSIESSSTIGTFQMQIRSTENKIEIIN